MRLTLGILFASAALAHTYHSSIAQLDYITARKTIEVIVWLHTEDMEQAFKSQKGPGANFDQAAEPFVRDYLRTHFELRTPQGQLLEQKWVGLEIKVHFLAAYLEVPASQLGGLTVTNRLLLDRVPDQLNSVQVRQDGKSLQDLQFTRQQAAPQTIQKPPNQPGTK